MTREEREDAINFFKEVAKREVGTYCKLAIEALEQQTCEEENQRLKKENEILKKEIEEAKKSKKEEDTGGWDFYYNGHGDYEEQRRCFYGDFS